MRINATITDNVSQFYVIYSATILRPQTSSSRTAAVVVVSSGPATNPAMHTSLQRLRHNRKVQNNNNDA